MFPESLGHRQYNETFLASSIQKKVFAPPDSERLQGQQLQPE